MSGPAIPLLDDTGDRWRLVYPAGGPLVTIALKTTRLKATITCQPPVKPGSDFPDEGNLREVRPIGAVGNAPIEAGLTRVQTSALLRRRARPMLSCVARSCHLFKARSRIRNRLPRPAHPSTM